MNIINQQIAIATAMGWKDIEIYTPPFNAMDGEKQQPVFARGHRTKNSIWMSLPEYTESQDLMHEVLSTLDQEGQFEFFYNLNEVVGLVDPFSPAWLKEFACFALINATAAQKAEAYLKTIGKWTN